MSSSKSDDLTLTKQERHDIIISYLNSINKPTKVFHLRWRPGELLNGKILRSTPMFWYMKYEWSREEIEEMFYKSRIEIDPLFDLALQQVFGGKPGPRWKSNNNQSPNIQRQKQWKQRHNENVAKWKAEKVNNLNQNKPSINNNNTEQKQQKQQNNNDTILIKNKLSQNIGSKTNEIWNAVSDFGADKSIDYKTFSDNLKDRGINVSPFLAKQLFDQLAKPSGTISKQGMEVLIKQLDQIEIAENFVNITWDDMATKLGTQLVMKRVLLAAGMSEPFNVDDFIYSSKINVNITPIEYMNKLTDRDIGWYDRLRAMEQISSNIGTNPLFNNLLCRENITDLLCGWSTQIIDNKPEVQKTAIELIPNIFNQCLNLSQDAPQIAINHLDEILSNLFKLLDDPKAAKNHKTIQDVITKIVDQVISINDPESILYLAGILSEKCDLENITAAPARAFAVEQIKKIMFENDGSIPKPGCIKREWLDIAANKQSGPIPLKNISKKYKRRGPPFAVLTSYPKETFPNEEIDFDGSKSRDFENNPCIEFTFDFGDGSEAITQKSPFIKYKYDKIGEYDVKLVVKDKNNETAIAMVGQRVVMMKSVNNKKIDNGDDGDNKIDDDDDDNKYDSPNSDGGDIDGLGKQFRIVVSTAIGTIFEDPNPDISKEGKRLIDIMKEINPNWTDLLEKNTKKRYFEFPMKPYHIKEEPKQPLTINSGKAKEHLVKTVITTNLTSQYPDI